MQNKSTKPKQAPILVQIGIFSTILFVSSLISALFPASFPAPTPVVGLVILYLLLTFKIVKLEWVDSFGSFLISIIAFLFVPSGISLLGSLDVMQKQGFQIIAVVIISTVIMLAVTYFVAYTIIVMRRKFSARKAQKEGLK
ncbi:hypothetical protein FC62_GL000945 [Amylolactobacillus amylotrophicus DSM 20534]|uniref:Murein hydrolase regulator LrgA n=3 Tax=Amylolactobacillus TaxID=2767876 RepID=A0A1L6XBL8_9LACO|nr:MULTISPECIES: CidA/LrgA family protein [Amylolactobacillus]APT18377.1 murein hydrolase regulator LrgA [Amylolactobacillus amylophilus DSM 20533 = JCM 1125]KRK38168.1 hypothetical protein FC62_GL000945 [Amylolactobacillus amylotrophicus DSM 20534]KRM43198.1 hypothetical protein FD40_GL000208 [Amylolactobacillus amylophilus DSM 20533 = JCM 1125]GED80399.1 murein hydrolase transporter LrgA [Amylolactobacillus amylophilus]